MAVLYGAGTYSEATTRIRKELVKITNTPQDFRTESEKSLLRRSEALDEIESGTDRPVLCTQKMLLHLKETAHDRVYHDRVYIDEDILRTLVETSSIHRNQLTGLPTLTQIAEQVERASEGVWTQFPPMRGRSYTEAAIKEILASQNSTGLMNLVRAQGFVRRGDQVHFGRLHRLPEKKIVVYSATASPELYRLALPGRNIHSYDVKPAQHTGRDFQCCDKSFSRSSLEKMTPATAAALEEVKRIVGDADVICAKNYKEVLRGFSFNVHGDLHFGALAGIDSLKGHDVAVIGTPHLDAMEYWLWACLFGLNPGILDNRQTRPTTITRNGYEFSFMSYSNDSMLREIQLHLIESELIQAAGRARTLREDCTVWVFSDLPLPNFEIYSREDIPRAEDLRRCSAA
jgi:hypothetical protein